MGEGKRAPLVFVPKRHKRYSKKAFSRLNKQKVSKSNTLSNENQNEERGTRNEE
jgi:hypothetical protein